MEYHKWSKVGMKTALRAMIEQALYVTVQGENIGGYLLFERDLSDNALILDAGSFKSAPAHKVQYVTIGDVIVHPKYGQRIVSMTSCGSYDLSSEVRIGFAYKHNGEACTLMVPLRECDALK